MTPIATARPDWISAVRSLRLMGALVVADGYQCPVIGDIGESIKEVGYHMNGERPAEFGR